MYEFNQYNLNIKSDFEIKTFKDRECDLDLLILLNDRTVNFNLNSTNLSSRLQFNDIKSILIRICKDPNSNIGTVHFLKDSGIHSTICNFEFNYLNQGLSILLKDYSVEMNFI